MEIVHQLFKKKELQKNSSRILTQQANSQHSTNYFYNCKKKGGKSRVFLGPEKELFIELRQFTKTNSLNWP